jgi:hypothetical protein
MRLNRSDYKILRQAAQISEAQRRLVGAKRSAETAASLAIGATAGALLLLLTGALMYQLADVSPTGATAGDQMVWREGPERVFR